MDIWPGSHVQHVKPKQQTNKCQCQCNGKVLCFFFAVRNKLLNIFRGAAALKGQQNAWE
jgi:hypothetical protein